MRIRMLRCAIFYGSAELPYHFDRAYRGAYADPTRYLTPGGLKRQPQRQGSAVASLTILSIVLSAACWIGALIDLVKQRKRSDLEHAFMLGLLAGLIGGIGLLLPARKAYFPHYANVLMPMMLWPLALSLDRAW